ncbi:MAG: hypothetical protein LQ341_002600 [Variospora aurantia]|nr:MAG: hypothetical protein LQ341_002600 [Variospora aurantia]
MVASVLQSVLGLAVGFTNLTALFGPSLPPDAQILLPNDANYSTQLTQRWTDYNAPSYIGAIKPATEADIQVIVTIATANAIPFLTTGGGHGTDDFHKFHGLSIDLSNFRTVHLDPGGNRLTVGGSAKIYQVEKLLSDAGKEFRATLGGGIGSLSGHRGLMVDSLKSVRMITASGELVEASKDQHADLFWAIRGAGSNFGIITSATYTVYDASNNAQVMNADFVFPASANQSFWQIMKEFDDTLPSRLALTAVAFYDRIHDQPVIAINAVFFGPLEEGEPHLASLKALGPSRSNIGMPSSTSSVKTMEPVHPNQHINIYTLGLKRIDPPTFESFFAKLDVFWQVNPDFQGRLLLQRFPNQAVQAVPDDDTAYGHRDVKTYMNIEGFYTDRSLDDDVNAFAKSGRSQFANRSGFETLVTYSNYAHGDEGPEAWYSARKLPQLSALKRKWDPDQLFSWNYPLPMQWP